ncbi:MAG: sulfatase [Planctomycetota bacterium]
MSLRRTTGRVLGSLAALAAGVLGIWIFWRSTIDTESLFPVRREGEQALFLALDRLEAARGVPGGSARLLKVHQTPRVNRAEGGMSLYAPPDGELLWRSVPIYENPELHVRFSLDPWDKPGTVREDNRCAFRIEARTPGKSVTLLDDHVLSCDVAEGVLGPPLQIELDAYQELVGQVIDIAFVTKWLSPALQPHTVAPLLPCWRHPVLRSRGRRVALGELSSVRRVVQEDLLASFSAAKVEPLQDVCVARRRLAFIAGVAVEEMPQPVNAKAVQVEPDFASGLNPSIPTGGSRPALVFSARGKVAFPLGNLPEGALLELYLGLKDHAEEPDHSLRPGGARFRVLIDGRVALDERLEAEVQGWQRREVDLSRWEGCDVQLDLEVTPDETPPRAFRVKEHQFLAGDLVWECECLAVQAAIGRPAVIVREEQHPRLSGEGRPNVLLIVSETLRADQLGCYEPTATWTPSLDRLAARGLLFERAVSASSWTQPSVASLLTGLDPVIHGVQSELNSFLADSLETLPEILQSHGVTTAAFVTNELLSADKNYNQGFETYVVPAYANARQTNELFTSWLAEHKDLQFFAYIHYFDPHGPYNAPGSLREKHVPIESRSRDHDTALQAVVEAMARSELGGVADDLEYLKGVYRGEVEYLDRQVGELMEQLSALGLREKTYVVFTADHGEEFGEHGWYGHGSALHAESVRVPLILAGPGVEPGRAGGVVETRSIFPTVLGWFGIEREAPARTSRLDLETARDDRGFAVASTRKAIADLKVLADPRSGTAGLKTLYSAEDPTWKLICEEVPGREVRLSPLALFQHVQDPGERQDVLAANPAVAEVLQRGLARWLEACREVALETHTGEMSPETRARLQALGYPGK